MSREAIRSSKSEIVAFDEKTLINESIPFLASIKLGELFGRTQLSWELRDDVNVLVGANGSGKSTILSIVGDLLGHTNIEVFKKVEAIELIFNNHFYVKSTKQSGMKINMNVEDMLHQVISKLSGSDQHSQELESSTKRLVDAFNRDSSSNFLTRRNFDFDDSSDENHNISRQINVEYLSTFDMQLMSKQELEDISGLVFTQLDVELEKELNRFASFQLKISRQTTNQYKSDNTLDFAELNQHNFAKINQFEASLNQLFSENGKTFVINDEGKVAISYRDDEIKLTDLSSGEKQLLLILLKVVNTSDKPTIFLLDEPEISLHLSWQEKLISTIRAISDQCQLIIVTHSPAIVMDGWMDCMVDIKDITTDVELTEND